MQKKIEKLQNHYILCGWGSVGREIVTELQRAGVPFVVVERNVEEAGVQREENVLYIEGDATDGEVLKMAGIERARGLIAALRGDPENVFVTLTARQFNREMQIVARAAEKGTESKLLAAGADRVISPYEIAGRRMASTALRPNVVNFLDVMTHGGGIDLRLEEVHLLPDSELVGKSLLESNLGRKTWAKIVGINDRRGRPRINPASNTPLAEVELQDGDILIAMGNDEEIRRLKVVAQG